MSPEIKAWSGATEQFFTPIPEAIAELKRRQNDLGLRARVEEFLEGDIPQYFKRGPILYLSRHVATPNFETLRFIELAQPYHLPIIIGQDTNDIFVSHNSLKRSLGKMPIVKYLTCDTREIIENFTIINFDKAQGRPLRDIHTIFGNKLVDFHNDLFKAIYPDRVTIIDDAEWIGRHHRGNLIEHYKKMLALFIVHGVMFENYELEDREFVNNVLAPSFEFVTNQFGLRPLICNLVPPELLPSRNWDSYPSVLYKIVKDAADLGRALS